MTGQPLQLAWQSFGRMAGMEAYQGALEQLVRAGAGEHAQVEVLRLPTARIPGKGFASAQALEVPAVLRSIADAIDRGAEAVAIGNGFDPGLWEARELFDVPVLGMLETMLSHALRVGWRVGVLCSGRSGPARVEELVARYGLAQRVLRPVALGVDVPSIMSAFEDDAAAATLIDGLGPRLAELEQRGAEVVVVASGALDVFLSSRGGRARIESSMVVLPSVTVLAAEVAAAARIARAGVPAASRVGRFSAPPAEVRAALGRDE